MKIVVEGYYAQRIFIVEWLVENVGPVIVTEAGRSIGKGWEIVDQTKYFFFKNYIVYIDDPKLSMAFALKWN